MDIAVPKTESKSTWFFLQPREVAPFLIELNGLDAPVKTPKVVNDIFSFAASRKMMASAPPEETDSEEELPEYLWYDQEEAKIEDILAKWEDGTAYESPEAAEAWMLEIKSLQEDIDSSPYIDDETKATYDEQFNTIYNQTSANGRGTAMYGNGVPLTLGDEAFGYTDWQTHEFVPPNSWEVQLSLQSFHNEQYPYYIAEGQAITDSLNTIEEMLNEDDPGPPIFVSAFDSVNAMYADLLDELEELADDPSNMTPAQMLLLQYTMTQLSQLVEALSNSLAGLNSMIMTMVRNFK